MIFSNCRQKKSKKLLLLAVTDTKYKEFKVYMGLLHIVKFFVGENALEPLNKVGHHDLYKKDSSHISPIGFRK